jgi:hypothetical protein
MCKGSTGCRKKVYESEGSIPIHMTEHVLNQSSSGAQTFLYSSFDNLGPSFGCVLYSTLYVVQRLEGSFTVKQGTGWSIS